MGGEKKRFCPVVLPIILIDLINSVHASAPKSISCWWGMGGGGSGRLQSFFLFVVKQNKTKWKTASIGNDMISEGLLVRAGEWRGRGEGWRVRNPSLNFQTFHFAYWGGNNVSVGILPLYLRFSLSLWQF